MHCFIVSRLYSYILFATVKQGRSKIQSFIVTVRRNLLTVSYFTTRWYPPQYICWKIIFEININIDKHIKKREWFGACPCIISKPTYIFIVTRELYLLIEIFNLIETLIKVHLQKQPPEMFCKESFRPATLLKRGPNTNVFLWILQNI